MTSDNQAETCLIITINDTSIGDLPLIITISDTCKNQPKRLDSDNTINLSRYSEPCYKLSLDMIIEKKIHGSLGKMSEKRFPDARGREEG